VLVSATFPRDVRALADRVQRRPVHVEATRLGTAHTDIDHVLHVVDPRQKVDAIVNLLLASPEAQTLVFAHTRSRVAEIAEELRAAGFAVASISGELDQRARNRALAAFRRGDLHVLVATDVAARGIDVQDIARVIQVDVPAGADSYTHRSGRTGRAGRKGISSMLVAPAGVEQAVRLLGRAGVSHRFEAIPSASELRRLADERAFAELSGDDPEGDGSLDERTKALAARLVAGAGVARETTLSDRQASEIFGIEFDPGPTAPVRKAKATKGKPTGKKAAGATKAGGRSAARTSPRVRRRSP